MGQVFRDDAHQEGISYYMYLGALSNMRSFRILCLSDDLVTVRNADRDVWPVRFKIVVEEPD